MILIEIEQKIIEELKKARFITGNKDEKNRIPFKKDEVDLKFSVDTFDDGTPVIRVWDESRNETEGDFANCVGSYSSYQEDYIEAFVARYNGRKLYINETTGEQVYATSKEEANKYMKSVSDLDKMMDEKLK